MMMLFWVIHSLIKRVQLREFQKNRELYTNPISKSNFLKLVLERLPKGHFERVSFIPIPSKVRAHSKLN